MFNVRNVPIKKKILDTDDPIDITTKTNNNNITQAAIHNPSFLQDKKVIILFNELINATKNTLYIFQTKIMHNNKSVRHQRVSAHTNTQVQGVYLVCWP